MTRDEWNYTSGCFRELLNKLEEGNFNRRVKYRFGLQFNPMFGFYHLWDGLEEVRDDTRYAPQTIATIKLRPKIVTVRHLPNFMFKEQLLKFSLSDRKSIFIPSENVGRHDGWVQNRIHSHVERRVQERHAFLEREQQSLNLPPFTLTIHIPIPQQMQYVGLSTATHTISNMVIRVVFNSQEQMERHGREAQDLITRAMHYGGTFVDGMNIGYDELVEFYRVHRQTHDRHQELEREYIRQRSGGLQNAMQSSGNFNAYQQTYFGRPMEQIQEALSGMVTEGTAINESTIMSAVNRLDELNVPRDENTYDRSTLRRLLNRDI